MESSHLVIFSTSGKFITKFNGSRYISLSETPGVNDYFGQGPGVEYQHLNVQFGSSVVCLFGVV